MAASLSMPPRDKCPGCHSAIYDGAREQGWCTDCMPPEIAVLRASFGRRKFSTVISAAVAAAVSGYADMKEGGRLSQDGMVPAQWFAMYHAQCTATDEFAKKAAAKSDAALLAQIAELEEQVAKLNRRIAVINDAVLLGEKVR